MTPPEATLWLILAAQLAFGGFVLADMFRPAPKAIRGTRKSITDLAPATDDPIVVARPAQPQPPKGTTTP